MKKKSKKKIKNQKKRLKKLIGCFKYRKKNNAKLTSNKQKHETKTNN